MAANVSEEPTASILRTEFIFCHKGRGKMFLQNTSNHLWQFSFLSSRIICILHGSLDEESLISSSLLISSMKLDSVITHMTIVFNFCHCENLKSHEDCCLLVWSLVEESTLKTETVYLSKTSAMIHLTVEHHIP
jgi:hypothetical protein